MKLTLLTIAVLIIGVYGRPKDFQPIDLAAPCDAEKCVLPNCRCPSTEIPGGLNREEIPQVIIKQFNDSKFGD